MNKKKKLKILNFEEIGCDRFESFQSYNLSVSRTHEHNYYLCSNT
jgi:hypothetical protein